MPERFNSAHPAWIDLLTSQYDSPISGTATLQRLAADLDGFFPHKPLISCTFKADPRSVLRDSTLPEPQQWLGCTEMRLKYRFQRAPGIWLHCLPVHKGFLHGLRIALSSVIWPVFIKLQASEKWVRLRNAIIFVWIYQSERSWGPQRGTFCKRKYQHSGK